MGVSVFVVYFLFSLFLNNGFLQCHCQKNKLPKLPPTPLEVWPQKPNDFPTPMQMPVSPSIESKSTTSITEDSNYNSKKFPSDKPPPIHSLEQPPLSSPGRWMHTAVFIFGKMYIFGGVATYSKQLYNDLWVYSPVTNEWVELQSCYVPPYPPPDAVFQKPPSESHYRPMNIPPPPPLRGDPVDVDYELANRIVDKTYITFAPTVNSDVETTVKENQGNIDENQLSKIETANDWRLKPKSVRVFELPPLPAVRDQQTLMHKHSAPYQTSPITVPSQYPPLNPPQSTPVKKEENEKSDSNGNGEKGLSESRKKENNGKANGDGTKILLQLWEKIKERKRGERERMERGEGLNDNKNHYQFHQKGLRKKKPVLEDAGENGGSSSFIQTRQRVKDDDQGGIGIRTGESTTKDDSTKQTTDGGNNNGDTTKDVIDGSPAGYGLNNIGNNHDSPVKENVDDDEDSESENDSGSGNEKTSTDNNGENQNDIVDEAQQQKDVVHNSAQYSTLPFVSNELWAYNVDTKLWSYIPHKVGLGQKTPPARWLHSAVVLKNRMVIFGGVSTSNVILGDLWLYNPVDNSWLEANVNGVPILPREGHTAVVYSLGNSKPQNSPTSSISTTNQPKDKTNTNTNTNTNADSEETMLVFGGISYGYVPFNDLWAYSPKENTWSLIQAKGKEGKLPAPRWLHSAAIFQLPTGGATMYVFGGVSMGYAPLDDLWAYHTSFQLWYQPTTNRPPGPRMLHSSVLLGEQMFVVGGISNNLPYEDLWSFDLSTTKWEEVIPSGVSPFAREGMSLVAVLPPDPPQTTEAEERPIYAPPDPKSPKPKIPPRPSVRFRKNYRHNKWFIMFGGARHGFHADVPQSYNYQQQNNNNIFNTAPPMYPAHLHLQAP